MRIEKKKGKNEQTNKKIKENKYQIRTEASTQREENQKLNKTADENGGPHNYSNVRLVVRKLAGPPVEPLYKKWLTRGTDYRVRVRSVEPLYKKWLTRGTDYRVRVRTTTHSTFWNKSLAKKRDCAGVITTRREGGLGRPRQSREGRAR